MKDREGRIFARGTLETGSYGFEWLCLPDDCYELYIDRSAVTDDSRRRRLGVEDEISFDFVNVRGEGFSLLLQLHSATAEHFCCHVGIECCT